MTPSTLQALSQTPEIDPAVVREFQQQGHVVVRNLFPPQAIREMHPVVMAAVERSGRMDIPLSHRQDTYSRAFVQVVNAGFDDQNMAVLTQSRTIGAWGAALLGVGGLRVMLEDTFLKLPGAGPTPWHQDSSVSPVDPKKVLTAWIPLQTTTQQMGGLRLVSGSHHHGLWGPVDISDDTQQAFDNIIEKQNFSIVDLPTLEPGDVSFHNGCTIHGAFPNVTTSNRLVVALHCFADGLPVIPIHSKKQGDLLHRLAPELRPGDLAISSNWPHLFSFH